MQQEICTRLHFPARTCILKNLQVPHLHGLAWACTGVTFREHPLRIRRPEVQILQGAPESEGPAGGWLAGLLLHVKFKPRTGVRNDQGFKFPLSAVQVLVLPRYVPAAFFALHYVCIPSSKDPANLSPVSGPRTLQRASQRIPRNPGRFPTHSWPFAISGMNGYRIGYR